MEKYSLVIAAVRGELDLLIENMRKSAFKNVGRREAFTGSIDGKAVRGCITGPGIINSVQALTAAIEEKAPSIIIQTGCAGLYKDSGLNIGDVGIATNEIDIHLGLENDENRGPVKELPFPVLKIKGAQIKNSFVLNEQWVDDAYQIIKRSGMGKKFQVKKGPFITTQTITASNQRAAELFRDYGPLMEAMEGAGSAHVAMLYGIPFIEIRSASNFTGNRNKKEWNLPLAFKNGAFAVMEYIKHMNP